MIIVSGFYVAVVEIAMTSWCCLCMQCSDNIKVLSVTITLFSAITGAQFLAAIFASSSALFVDAVTMLVDTATYIGNLFSECFNLRSSPARAHCEIFTSGFSFVVLIGVAFWGMADSFKVLARLEQDSGEADDVNAQVVLAFGVSGIVLDLASFCAFYRWGKKALGRRAPVEYSAEDDDIVLTEEGQNKPQVSMTMVSAFLHVGADFLRSLTITIEGLAVIWFGYNGSWVDGIATFFVSATIFVGSCGTMTSFLRRGFKRPPSEKPSNPQRNQNSPSGNPIGCSSDMNSTI